MIRLMDYNVNDIEVLVFKTNINTDTELSIISNLLNKKIEIIEWTIDREDIDKVLRVEAIGLHTETLIDLITAEGFLCQELPD